jgi:hypothetical protein
LSGLGPYIVFMRQAGHGGSKPTDPIASRTKHALHVCTYIFMRGVIEKKK